MFAVTSTLREKIRNDGPAMTMRSIGKRTLAEVLHSVMDGMEDDKLPAFALRLALTGHVEIPRECRRVELRVVADRGDPEFQPAVTR